MRILYLGDDVSGATSCHRADALRRLGHTVIHINPRRPIPKNRWMISLAIRTGFRPWLGSIRRYLATKLKDVTYELIWVDCGAEISPRILSDLKRGLIPAVNYNHDDPFGRRDGRKWDQYLKAVPLYDLLVVVRAENILEAKQYGAKRVVRIFRPYDPVAHAPVALSATDIGTYSSEVVFVGTWWPGRDIFLEKLIRLGIPLSIWGSRWSKAPNFSILKPYVRGREANGIEYVKVIQCAKIALGLLSHENRDLHTTRSAEVPFIGGAVFCAERTDDHELLFKDKSEAALWSSGVDCARICTELLHDEPRRRQMAAAARAKIIAWRLSNDEILSQILDSMNGNTRKHSLLVYVD